MLINIVKAVFDTFKNKCKINYLKCSLIKLDFNENIKFFFQFSCSQHSTAHVRVECLDLKTYFFLVGEG